ncbi:type-2 ice-structuring protein-like [Mya arenaria]|uniref:type-2 ice-structuring protein-like n=1 Tax=Mya arenaria TaxID=6604 RepID=UPI0022DF9145|nr:type-2 ice-structuring protein-like [Mya arenaria]
MTITMKPVMALTKETVELGAGTKMAFTCRKRTKKETVEMGAWAVYVQKEGNNKACNIGWHLFGSLCYYIETKKRKWTSARDNCEIMGARLATIRNQTQEGFLETLISASCLPVMEHWFGGRYSKPLGQWTWVSGEPFEYRNWDKAIGEPDRNLNCCMVKASNGLWRDRLCGDFFHYSVCEKLAVYH